MMEFRDEGTRAQQIYVDAVDVAELAAAPGFSFTNLSLE